MKILIIIAIIIASLNFSVKGQCTGEDIINLKKTALIFGEKDYTHSKPLTNPINDAVSISDSLRKLGFDVNIYYNNNHKDMVNYINNWYATLPKYDVALFYFSGHGIEVNGENYLLPIDSNPKSPSELPYVACSANDILANMEGNNSKYNIMILDACRDNPLLKSWTRNIKDGLATMSGNGSFIGFASAPGTTASDGNGKNGTYTESILKYIMMPDLPITQIFTKVNSDVRAKTFGAQIPFLSSSLSLDFCFNVTSKISSVNSSKIVSFQPSSKTLLTPNGEKVFIVDSLDQQLKVRDARNFNDITPSAYKGIHAYKLASVGTDNIYTIDTTSYSIIGLDYKKASKILDFKLPYKPTSLIVSNDERKFYVLTNQSSSNSEIDIIDLIQRKISNKITLNNRIENISVSLVNNRLYAISSCSAAKKGLYTIDSKLVNTSTFYEGVACGAAVSVSPSNGKIFVSNVDVDGINQINILDGKSIKVLKTIDFKTFSFYFTIDNKYVLALGESEILIIDSKSDEVLNKVSFETKPEGVTLSDDGRAFVTLPREGRIFAFSVSKQSEKDSLETPEAKMRNFKEQLKKRNTIDPQFRINETLSKFNEEFINAISIFNQELGPSYEHYSQDDRTPNFKEGTASYHWGIRSKNDHSKIIFPLIKIKTNGNVFVITMKDKGNEEVYRSFSRNTDWEKVKTFIKNFYYNRIKQLDP